jgi:hypothetical protein
MIADRTGSWSAFLDWAQSRDYFSLTLSVAIPNPATLTLVGVSGVFTLTKTGDLYYGPVPTVGKSVTGVAVSLFGGKMDLPANLDPLTRDININSFVQGMSLNISTPDWKSLGFTGRGVTINTNGKAQEWGFQTPNLGGATVSNSNYQGNIGFSWGNR